MPAGKSPRNYAPPSPGLGWPARCCYRDKRSEFIVGPRARLELQNVGGPQRPGDNAARRAEDIGGQELSYAEVKAIASGNPAVLTLAEADAELQRLTLLKKNHLDEQYVARRSVQGLPATIASLSGRLSNLVADEATTKSHASDPIAIGGRTCPHKDIPDILGGKLDGMPKNVREPTRIPLGNYRGLSFGLVLHSQFPPDVYLEGASTRLSTLSRDHQGPRAVLNALERLADGYVPECSRVRQDLGIAESQLRDYQARLGKPFLHDQYLVELTTLRDGLKAGLSTAQPEPGNESGPSVSELADKIKALKAAHNIEAAPQRIGQRQSTAEEPVTARIRRRTEALPASDPSSEHAAASPPEAKAQAIPEVHSPGTGSEHASITQDSSINPEMTFQERLAIKRQKENEGPPSPA